MMGTPTADTRGVSPIVALLLIATVVLVITTIISVVVFTFFL